MRWSQLSINCWQLTPRLPGVEDLRILTLSQWHAPEPDFKIHPLGQELHGRGHSVTAITGFPNYPEGKLHDGYRTRWRQWEEMDGVRVLRLPLYPEHSSSGIKRSLNYLSFAASASLLGPALCGPADAMWVYHPPLTIGIPAWWIGMTRRVPYIYEVQDMWPETLSATNMVSSRRILAMVSKLSRAVYAGAAAITVISPGFKRNLVSKGVPEEKIHVIPNWADEENYRPMEYDNILAANHGLAGKFNVVYGGNLGAAQALGNVLKAAALLTDLPDVQFVFIGDGVEEGELQRGARAAGLSNVRFIHRQPVEKMPCFFALADALLVHLKRDPLFEITIPSKTISYLACGRPVIAAIEGDGADVVSSAGAGLTCRPEDPEALAEAVRTLHKMPVEKRIQMGAAGRNAYLGNYTRKQLMDRYEMLLAAVAKKE